jgi:hypothetical protein
VILEHFFETLKSTPERIDFEDTMSVIDGLYEFTPVAFSNGELQNRAGENSGSCKLFAFAKEQGLSEQDTLNCFGRFYRVDVLSDPDGESHQNIRNFIRTGWSGIRFDGSPIRSK